MIRLNLEINPPYNEANFRKWIEAINIWAEQLEKESRSLAMQCQKLLEVTEIKP